MKIAGVNPSIFHREWTSFQGSRSKDRDPADKSQRGRAFEKFGRMKIAGMNPSIFLRKG